MIADRNVNNGVIFGSTSMRLSSWYFFSIMASYISLFFSTSIILDLYSVLKNPFSSTEARIKKLTTIAIILSIGFSTICLRLTLSDNDKLQKLNLYLFLGIALTNLLLGIVIMIFVFVRFRTKGMSKNIKSQI